MIVISSRMDITSVVNIPSKRQTYHLPGLSALNSMYLLQEVAFNELGSVPEEFQQGENIDFMRRIARRQSGRNLASGSISEAHKLRCRVVATLLYGVCQMNKDDQKKCHFVRTLHGALNRNPWPNLTNHVYHSRNLQSSGHLCHRTSNTITGSSTCSVQSTSKKDPLRTGSRTSFEIL